MRVSQRTGLCLPTNRTVRSIRAKCHARPIRVWRSLIE